LRKILIEIHEVCFAGIGSSLPPTERVTKRVKATAVAARALR